MTMRLALIIAFTLVAAIGGSLPAAAHITDAVAGGWTAGLTHPLSGLDHALAMSAIGVWAAQIGQRSIWLLPLSFLAALAVGATAGMLGVALPGVEFGVAGSAAALGLLIALAIKPEITAGVSAVALFALFHGLVHGAELPSAASPVSYMAGFLAASTGIIAVGLLAGHALRNPVALSKSR
ncbi:MAG: hypothetical protein A3G18_02805 [Rhodospirillales bacterium RIFCSPLOWO2_12_FULL_58_28]|nr:MAG: hypothetical protein A3H92_00770 [Rhodospirillales bacterium RIFCSPLOWO2_02_FULL_58_16]OHC77078.1 MAG: hypothetical protein A3G18_02805 [Rhodospirillales bacterium RIFCSPLOWO2_12_FULL_58_28]